MLAGHAGGMGGRDGLGRWAERAGGTAVMRLSGKQAVWERTASARGWGIAKSSSATTELQLYGIHDHADAVSLFVMPFTRLVVATQQ